MQTTQQRSQMYSAQLLVNWDRDSREPAQVQVNDQVYALTPLGSVESLSWEASGEGRLESEAVACDGLGLLLAFERALTSMSADDARKALAFLDDDEAATYRLGTLHDDVTALLRRLYVQRLVMLSGSESC